MSKIYFDLEFWMVAGTLLCGLIWGIYSLLSRKKTTGNEPLIVEYARSFFPVLLVVIILRSFVAEPFRIPSGSMMPTLEVGDFILVNKFAYGVRLPVLRTKLLDTGKPQRGDVFVFRFPEKPWQNFIKRVIGLPGDHIRWDREKLYVNGERVTAEAIGEYIAVDQAGGKHPAKRLKETLGSVEHDIILMNYGSQSSGETTVPEGKYFAMGDNRFGSNDSRYWGFVPEENLVGKAMFIWMHYAHNNDGLEFSRIGTGIE
jgi:signal peptidase I